MAEQVRQFSLTYLTHKYDDLSEIPDCHLEWWALFFCEHPLVSIAAPRGHAKSTSLTFALSLFLLCHRMSRHLLIIGANEELGAQFLTEIRTELTENEELIKKYRLDGFAKETGTQLVLRFTDGPQSRIFVRGAMQRMRGTKWRGKRPDWILFDDMEDEEIVLNELRIRKFIQWFMGAVRPLGGIHCKIRGVGTIIGFGSFLESTMPNEKAKTTVTEPLRVYSERPGAWLGVKYRAHNEDFSQILWGERFDRAFFEQKRAEYAEIGQTDIYGQEYLNDPIDPTTAYYRQQDFLPMRPVDHETRKAYYAAADLAIGESKRAAYSVIVVGGLDAEGFLNIVDVRRGRWDGLQIVDEMMSVQRRYNPEMFRLESENIAKAIGAFLYRRMDEEQRYINISDKTPTKDKDARGRSSQARMRAGRVRFHKEAEWYPDFEEELLRYPKFRTKDQFDAFAWLGLMLEEMIEPMTDEDIEEEAWFIAREQAIPQGRSRITGY